MPPLTVNVKPELPAVMLVGEMLESDGRGFVTAKASGALVPPPEAALVTVIDKEPAVARSFAVSVAVS